MRAVMKVFVVIVCFLGYGSAYYDNRTESHRQSPINIDTRTLHSAIMPPLKWSSSYFDLPNDMEVNSDDHSIVVTTSHDVRPTLSGGPLPDDYRVQSFHFHWAAKNSKGSEHTINGNSYVMEMHVVHTKGNLSMAEARKLSDGIVVVGYFVEILKPKECKNRNVEAFSIITDTILELKEPNKKIKMKSLFPLKNIVVPFRYEFVNYYGSLTTPPYDESVVWILSPYTLKITQDQLNKFRELYARKLVEHPDNYRNVQDIECRNLFFSRSPYPKRQVVIDREIYKYFYPAGDYCKNEYVNIFKNFMYHNNKYDYNVDREPTTLHETIPLAANHIYYFDDTVHFPADHKPDNVKFVRYGDTDFPVYYNKDLNFGVDIKGLMKTPSEPIDSIDSFEHYEDDDDDDKK